MKQMFLKTNLSKMKWLAYPLMASLFLVGCQSDTEEISIDESLESTSESFATPTVGKTYYIRNRGTGKYLDITNKSNSNGANLQQWGTTVNAGQTHRQWEILSVGNGYVRLKGVDSGKSLEVNAGSNNAGANVQQWAYNGRTHQQWELISTGSGYYRIKGRDSGKSIQITGGNKDNGANATIGSWNGWNKYQWMFTEVSGGSTGGGDGGTTTGGDTPGKVLGIDNGDWKLNGFTASPSSSATYYDDVMDQVNGNINTWSNSNYFYESNGWAYFKCYRGLGGSKNSNNPRVELRELNGNGGLANWDGSSGTHIMEYDVRVDRLPRDADGKGGVLCFGQIHGPSGNNRDGVKVDDAIRLQFIGDEDQTSGNVRLKISGYVTEDIRGGSLTLSTTYRLDTSYRVKIQYSGGTIQAWINGSRVISQKMDTSTEGNYFKVGNYLQSVKDASFTGSYGLVGIKNLSIRH